MVTDGLVSERWRMTMGEEDEGVYACAVAKGWLGRVERLGSITDDRPMSRKVSLSAGGRCGRTGGAAVTGRGGIGGTGGEGMKKVAESGGALPRFPKEDDGLTGSTRAYGRRVWMLPTDGRGRGLLRLRVEGVLGRDVFDVDAFEGPRFLRPFDGARRAPPCPGSSSRAHVPSTQPLVFGSSWSIGAASEAITPF